MAEQKIVKMMVGTVDSPWTTDEIQSVMDGDMDVAEAIDSDNIDLEGV